MQLFPNYTQMHVITYTNLERASEHTDGTLIFFFCKWIYNVILNLCKIHVITFTHEGERTLLPFSLVAPPLLVLYSHETSL